MNLQPLYDVKGRLEAAAISGVSLLGEDFRLQRAAEGLKPLAGASPVLGKIDAGLQGLLSAPAAERPGRLLDLLALVDAVVCTQGRTGLDGEMSPLPAGAGQYLELSFSQLQPLLTALTGTGGGRIETVRSAWENHPEFFADFRVLPALVSGLGDSYAELADLNEAILKAQGSWAVPLLKKGFDPAGKKEMARRVEVIAALEGAGATPWLREVLPQAKKDVRGAVILALGADPENVPLLLDLSKTERGSSREAVLRALA
ncbi:MAG: HEAT repeat domain-containing protein, partial [Lawsonibacter sp.]|nr:HEAT repeat domain-containing protein [Lawsonibacter sp.]